MAYVTYAVMALLSAAVAPAAQNTFLITFYQRKKQNVKLCAIFCHKPVKLPLAKWDQCI